MHQSQKTRKMVIIAMFCAIAYVVMAICRFSIIPAVPFLKYDPKDVVITIGGFLFGPLNALIISLIVSFLEMITLSESGIIGMLMNVLATCSFACTATYIYKKRHTLNGAIIGLVAGTLLMTAVMILWNYLITPLYMTVPREDVVKMLIPAFLPFNILKGTLNATLTMLLYKPLVITLRKSNLIPLTENTGSKGKINIGVILIGIVLLITCTIFIFVLKGII